MGGTTYEITVDNEERKRAKGESSLDLVRVGLGEFGSLFVIVFLSCMGCTDGIVDEKTSSLHKSLAAGFSVIAAMQIFGHISGAHANPAVTLSAYVMDKIDYKKALLYLVSQILGSLTGYAALLYVTPKVFITSPGHCVTLPSEKISIAQAFVVEVIITFILCVAVNAAWDHRCTKRLDSIALRIGLIVTGCVLAAGPYTGASMNPARSLGPAIWQRNFDSLHIYIFGPLFGGGLSGFFYKHILLVDED